MKKNKIQDNADNNIDNFIMLLEENGFYPFQNYKFQKIIQHIPSEKDKQIVNKEGEVQKNTFKIIVSFKDNAENIRLNHSYIIYRKPITEFTIIINSSDLEKLKITIEYCLSGLVENYSRIMEFSSVAFGKNSTSMDFFIRPSNMEHNINQLILIPEKKYRSILVAGNTVKLYDKLSHGIFMKEMNNVTRNKCFTDLLNQLPKKIQEQLKNHSEFHGPMFEVKK